MTEEKQNCKELRKDEQGPLFNNLSNTEKMSGSREEGHRERLDRRREEKQKPGAIFLTKVRKTAMGRGD